MPSNYRTVASRCPLSMCLPMLPFAVAYKIFYLYSFYATGGKEYIVCSEKKGIKIRNAFADGVLFCPRNVGLQDFKST